MLRIEGRTPPQFESSLEDLSAELDKGAALAKALEHNKGNTFSLSSFASSNSSDNEEEA